jgi:hypothetical protein
VSSPWWSLGIDDSDNEWTVEDLKVGNFWQPRQHTRRGNSEMHGVKQVEPTSLLSQWVCQRSLKTVNGIFLESCLYKSDSPSVAQHLDYACPKTPGYASESLGPKSDQVHIGVV